MKKKTGRRFTGREAAEQEEAINDLSQSKEHEKKNMLNCMHLAKVC